MKRLLAGIGMVVLAAVGAAACGDDGGTAAGNTVVTVGATNYQTIPPTPSTIAPSTTAANAPGSVTVTETEYVIAPGDLPATIANTWKIPLQALLDANGWTLEGQYVTNFPAPGTTIKIPAGATVPGTPVGPTATTVPPAGATTTAPPAATTTTGAPVSACGTYTITKEDTTRIGVANKVNTTVDKLDAANVNTKGYSAFYPGLVIQLPC